MKIFIAALICGCVAVAVGSIKEDLFQEAFSMPAPRNKHCSNNPCKEAICRQHPEAECRPDYCRGDAVWYEGDKEVDCNECPYNRPRWNCKDECKKEPPPDCPNYPEAPRTKRCRMYDCGQCSVEYFDPGSNYPLHCHGQ